MLIAIVVVVIAFVIFAVIISNRSNTHSSQNEKHNPLYMERMEIAKRQAEERGDTEAVQAILEDRYDELVTERALKKQAKTVPSVASYSYNIAGINFRRGIKNYIGHSTGFLKPQPNNSHDPNAIAVYSSDNHHLGYIPADETNDVRYLRLRFPIPVEVYIEECCDSTDHHFFVGTVTIKIKSKNR